MGLQKTTVNFNLASTIDTKTEAKLVANTKLKDARNVVQRKIGTFKKRFGREDFTKTVNNSTETIGAFDGVSGVTSHQEKILMTNSGNMFIAKNDKTWNKVGPYYSVAVTENPVSGETRFTVDHSFAENATYVVHAYTIINSDTKDLAYITDKYRLFVLLVEKSTGITVWEREIENSSNYFACFGGKVFFYSNGDIGLVFKGLESLGQTIPAIYYQRITTANVVLNSTQIATEAGPIFVNRANDAVWKIALSFNVAKLDATAAVSEGFVLLYHRTTSTANTSFWKTGVFTGAGVITSGGLFVDVAPPDNYPYSNGGALFYDPADPNVYYAATQIDDVGAMKTLFQKYTLAAGSLTRNFTRQLNNIDFREGNSSLGPDPKWYRTQCLVQDPTDATRLYLFGDTEEAQPSRYPPVGIARLVRDEAETEIHYSILKKDNSSVPLEDAILCRGITPTSQFFVEPSTDSILFIGSNNNTAEKSDGCSYFLMNALKLNVNNSPAVLAMFQNGIGVGRSYFNNLWDATISAGVIKAGLVKKTDISATELIGFGNLNQFVIYESIASLFELTLSPKFAFSNVYMNEARLLSSGYLSAFDGIDLYDAGFLFNPLKLVAETRYVMGLSATVAGNDVTIKFQNAKTVRELSGYNITVGGAVFQFRFTRIQSLSITGNNVTGGTLTFPMNDNWSGAELCYALGNYLKNDLTWGLSTFFTNTDQFYLAFGAAPSVTYVYTDAPVTAITQGIYTYTAVLKYIDRQGNVHRSAPSLPLAVDVQGVTGSLTTAVSLNAKIPIAVINKDWSRVEVEFYRTALNGTSFQLVSTSAVGSLAAETSTSTFTTFNEKIFITDQCNVAFADWSVSGPSANYALQEFIYTNGDIQDNAPVGAIQAMTRWRNRIAVVESDDKTRVRYTKEILPNEGPQFTIGNEIRVDFDGQEITALEVLDEKLFFFKVNQVFYTSGDGANDLGLNGSVGVPTQIPTEVGAVNQAGVARIPQGIVFRSLNGFYLLDRSLNISYIGAGVEDYNSAEICSSVIFKDEKEVRFYSSSNDLCFVLNYETMTWSIFDNNYTCDDATSANGVQVQVKSDGTILREVSNTFRDFVGGVYTAYAMKVKTAWLKLKGLQDFQRIYRMSLLGEYKSPHTLTVKVAYDYDPNLSFVQTYTYDPAITQAGTERADRTYQPNFALQQQKCEAMEVEIIENAASGTYESLTMTDLAFNVGMKTGLYPTRDEKVV